MKNVLILAGGKSTRFGRNKLEEVFNNKTLPQMACEFAINNGAKNIYVTLSKFAVKTDGHIIYHEIFNQISRICNPIIRFQNEDIYGTGAAIMSWINIIDEPFVVLFGDNYYDGIIDSDIIAQLNDVNNDDVIFTSLSKDVDPRNNQLAAIKNSFIIEKPHSFLEGDFFCGFVRFPKNYLNNCQRYKKSDRGEIEITDMINMANNRQMLDLLKIGVIWDDLTYDFDIPRIRKLVDARQ